MSAFPWQVFPGGNFFWGEGIFPRRGVFQAGIFLGETFSEEELFGFRGEGSIPGGTPFGGGKFRLISEINTVFS